MSETRLQIKASRKLEDSLSSIGVYIFTSNIGLEQYLCDSININIKFSSWYMGNYSSYEYAQEGSIEITRYDLENRIVSGRFNALLKLEGCEDIVITDGRFDLKQ